MAILSARSPCLVHAHLRLRHSLGLPFCCKRSSENIAIASFSVIPVFFRAAALYRLLVLMDDTHPLLHPVAAWPHRNCTQLLIPIISHLSSIIRSLETLDWCGRCGATNSSAGELYKAWTAASCRRRTPYFVCVFCYVVLLVIGQYGAQGAI